MGPRDGGEMAEPERAIRQTCDSLHDGDRLGNGEDQIPMDETKIVEDESTDVTS